MFDSPPRRKEEFSYEDDFDMDEDSPVFAAPRKACDFYHSTQNHSQNCSEFYDTSAYQDHMNLQVSVHKFSMDSPKAHKPSPFQFESTSASSAAEDSQKSHNTNLNHKMD